MFLSLLKVRMIVPDILCSCLGFSPCGAAQQIKAGRTSTSFPFSYFTSPSFSIPSCYFLCSVCTIISERGCIHEIFLLPTRMQRSSCDVKELLVSWQGWIVRSKIAFGEIDGDMAEFVYGCLACARVGCTLIIFYFTHITTTPTQNSMCEGRG